jgi:hypothetical protein
LHDFLVTFAWRYAPPQALLMPGFYSLKSHRLDQ